MTTILPMESLDHSSLHELAREGNLSLLKESDSRSLQAQDNTGATLLHAAASKDQVEVMEYLTDCGIPLNATDSKGNTALHLATQNVCINAVNLLLERKANDTVLNQDLDAPLHIAVRSNNLQLVQVFLRHPNVELVVHGYRKHTPLHLAAELDLVEIVEAIHAAAITAKQNKSFPLCAGDADGATPIHYAARCGSHKVLDLMLTKALEHVYTLETILEIQDNEHSTPLHTAVDAGYLETVIVLLKHGASPITQAENQLPPLHLACYQGRLMVVKVMVEKHGPDILHSSTSDGSTPLHCAAQGLQTGHLIQYLIEQGASLNARCKEGFSPLLNAVIFGRTEAMKELVRAGADCHDRGPDGSNIFHYVVKHNQMAILNLLSDPKLLPLVYLPDQDGLTPLHQACILTDQGNMAQSLIDMSRAFFANQTDPQGNNYLHLAAVSGHHNTLESILGIPQAATMLNERNHSGETPLHKASVSGCLECIKLLLGKGACVHRCHGSKSPFLVACFNGHEKAARMLLQAYPPQKDWVDNDGNSGLHLAATSGKPATLSMCLSSGIPITHNQDGDTFLDLIIKKESECCAQAVVKHERWQECLDYPTIKGRKHSFQQLIEVMPGVAKAVLDRCHTKSNLPCKSPSYWEEYNFKYMQLEEQIPKPSSKMVTEMGNMNLTGEDKGQERKKGHILVPTTRVIFSSLLAMVVNNRAELLIHPVTSQFLKTKWEKYGRIIACTHWLMFFLHALFLSIFIATTPPARLNITATGELLSNMTVLPQLSIASNVIRFVTLFITLFNLGFLLMIGFSIGPIILRIIHHQYFWLELVSIAATFAFLVPWQASQYGLDHVFWEAGAVAVFFAWSSVMGYGSFIDSMGLYMTMFLKVLASVLKVLVLVFPILLTFAQTFYILVGDFLPFRNLGQSLFIMFAYLHGEIDYEAFLRKEEMGTLHYSFLTLAFVLGAGLFLAIALMNLLIGLAVGDIEKIRSDAILEQYIGKVRAFTLIDPLWSRIVKRCQVVTIRIYPNKKTILKQLLHFVLSEVAEKPTSNYNTTDFLLEQQQDQLQLLSQQVTNLQQMVERLTSALDKRTTTSTVHQE